VIYAMMILFYILLAGGVFIIILTTVNRKISAVAVSSLIIGLAVYVLIDQALGTMILKCALFVICLLIAIRVAKSILGE